MKGLDLYIREAQCTPQKTYSKISTMRCIIIKLSRARDKGRYLEAAREKHTVKYKGAAKRPATAFSSETIEDTSQ